MVNANKNISGSGFNPITQNFIVQVGDEIRFDGTETQTYYIKEVIPQEEKLHCMLDRNITAQDLDYFLTKKIYNRPFIPNIRSR